jgi:hypothetical protein
MALGMEGSTRNMDSVHLDSEQEFHDQIAKWQLRKKTLRWLVTLSSLVVSVFD